MSEQDFKGWALYCEKCGCWVANDAPNWLACYHTTRKIEETHPDEWHLQPPTRKEEPR